MSTESSPVTVPASGDLSRRIAHLSDKMQVPLDQIEEIYAGEVDRLAADARLQQFVSILAIGRTRAILQRRRAGSGRRS